MKKPERGHRCAGCKSHRHREHPSCGSTRRCDLIDITLLKQLPGRTLDEYVTLQARKRIREALARGRTRKTPLLLREEIQLPKDGADAVLRLERARQAIDAAERDAVTVLVRRLGLGVRDAAIALGLSMRRVVHLAGEVSDAEAERRYERRAAAHR